MASTVSSGPTLTIRPLQYRDLDTVKHWGTEELDAGDEIATEKTIQEIDRLCRWYGPLKVLSLLPKPVQQSLTVFVAEHSGQLVGLIQVSPFNRGRSTWQVDHIAVNRIALTEKLPPGFMDVGSRLLRHCFDKVWEARTWIIETDVNNRSALALYRFNGFQPLAQVTYWSLPSELMQSLAEREPDLPNLLPVSNADAQLLYQLDTASMPPLVRQVFDHQIQDFKAQPLAALSTGLERWRKHTEVVSAYVFEHQRKAAIGYFKLAIARDGKQPHQADLMVHPAYTWLYPEMVAQMARILQPFPAQSLRLASLDYQPEREEYLNQIQAAPEEHSLLMSRSVWHKVRESRPLSLEGLQLSDVLSGLKPVGKPVPGRMSWSADRWQTLLNSSTVPPVPPRKGTEGAQPPNAVDSGLRFETAPEDPPEKSENGSSEEGST
ncbi:GNAT family N-acetyltransferase [Pseudanabaena sp. FACHB-2040]|uniref:GNAT family N-acetyltransferase n=1 Tax=Pseudanabaena sp. FACHB-2040 TaxID=2692859 RepID=UPI001685F074|nr:GNAT family N-acetyltransferase [Pseudanabaena sp. FACHB-2040]MBD2260429.1 GNAT family N-acetyltransferase [Pseudanabaena sp. FACHB-2040]